MRKVIAVVLALLLAGPASLLAQKPEASPQGEAKLVSSMKPFLAKSFTTKKQYADNIRNCLKTQGVWLVSCRAMAERANALFDLGIEADTSHDAGVNKVLSALAEVVMNSDVLPCPQKEGKLDAADSNGAVISGGVKRFMKDAEPCVLSSTLGRWIGSLMCGNFIEDLEFAYFDRAEVEEKAPTAEPAPPAPTPVEVRLDPDQVAQAVRDAIERERGRQSSSSPTSASFLSPKRPGFWIVTGVVVIGGTALALLARPSASATSCAYVGVNATGGCAVK